MGELISVIINVYNGEKFIEKCLDCIINQTYKNLDILIVNDGSTDNTLKICENYKDDRIRIITQGNMGLSKARNVGIENAKGEYLYFIDVDDWIELDTIEYLYNLCKKYNTKMSTCRPIDVYDYNIKVVNKPEEIKVVSSLDMLKKVLLAVDRAVTIWNKLIKKELFETIRFEDRIINDVTVTYKLMIEADKTAYSNQIKYYYLRHKNAVTSKEKENAKRSIDNYKVSIDRYNYIKNLYPDFIYNDIGMIRVITMLYLRDNKELDDFLNEQNAMELFKKLFSFKVFTCPIKFKEKIKILLFLISPRFCKFVDRKYHDNNKFKM